MPARISVRSSSSGYSFRSGRPSCYFWVLDPVNKCGSLELRHFDLPVAEEPSAFMTTRPVPMGNRGRVNSSRESARPLKFERWLEKPPAPGGVEGVAEGSWRPSLRKKLQHAHDQKPSESEH